MPNNLGEVDFTVTQMDNFFLWLAWEANAIICGNLSRKFKLHKVALLLIKVK